MWIKRRSKSYVLITMSPIPFGLDEVLESISDKRQRVKFIYGNGIFIVFFHSRKRHSFINEIAMVKLKNIAQGLFIFRNKKNTLDHLSPLLATKMGEITADDIGSSDLANLTYALNMLSNGGGYIDYAPEGSPIPPFADNDTIVEDEYELTPDERMDALLVKMRKTGYNSLTPAELDFLKEYRDNNTKNKDNELDK